MKVLLVAVNAKYIHSNLAVYDLKAYTENIPVEVELAEYTINQQQEEILRDIYEHKAELIAEGAHRLGISIVKTSVRDASVEDTSAIGAYDRVLADVPCSGLGLLRKKPDIRLKKDGSRIDALVGIQRQILEQAAKYVKDGSVLVYST